MHHHTIECATQLAKCSCCHGWWCRFMYGLIVCCPRIVHTKIVTPSPSHSPTIVLVILRRIACIHNERCVLNYPRSLNLLSPFNRPDSFIVAVLSPMHSNACKHVNTISLHKHKQTTYISTHYIDIALLLIRSAISTAAVEEFLFSSDRRVIIKSGMLCLNLKCGSPNRTTILGIQV